MTKICINFGTMARVRELDDQFLSSVAPDLFNGRSIVAGSVGGSDNRRLRARLKRLNPHLVN